MQKSLSEARLKILPKAQCAITCLPEKSLCEARK
jgi:hypothetical protein